MNGMRSSATPPTGRPPIGYDRLEFAPQDCGRDFPSPPRRRRVGDEERAHLRRVTADLRAQPSDDHQRTGSDLDMDSEAPPGDGSSRLYRD